MFNIFNLITICLNMLVNSWSFNEQEKTEYTFFFLHTQWTDDISFLTEIKNEKEQIQGGVDGIPAPQVTLHSVQEPNFQKKLDVGRLLLLEAFLLMVYS